MNIEKLAKQMFNEIVKDYENEKMIENRGYVQRTTSAQFLGGIKNV